MMCLIVCAQNTHTHTNRPMLYGFMPYESCSFLYIYKKNICKHFKGHFVYIHTIHDLNTFENKLFFLFERSYVSKTNLSAFSSKHSLLSTIAVVAGIFSHFAANFNFAKTSMSDSIITRQSIRKDWTFISMGSWERVLTKLIQLW